MKTISILAMGLTAALSFASAAEAMPVQPIGDANANIVQVAGGCGPYRHRGPYGGCRPGGRPGGFVRGRACPPGFHLGPYGRRCRPN